MSSTIVQYLPIVTQRCAHPCCCEIIYRDTLDKDPAWRSSEFFNRAFCSFEHALEAERNSLYGDMIKQREWFQKEI